MCNACIALAGAVTVFCILASCMESFPGNARRIVNPRFFRFGVTTACLTLLDHVPARFLQSSINFIQLVLVVHLNAKMIETRLSAARRNRRDPPGLMSAGA